MSYLKAIFAGVFAGVGALAVALNDNQITTSEWARVAYAALSAAAVTWGVPNIVKPAPDGTRVG